MGHPVVSIIIPVYKTEKYLRNCLLSVQRQTMPDFEAILVNDCTPDESMQIAKEFARSDPRFRIIEHSENKGLGCARNTGMSIAEGKYLNFLDSDDSLPLDAIEIMLKIAETDKADMVIGNMAWINGHRLNSVKYIEKRLQSWETSPDYNVRNLSFEDSLIGSICNRLTKNTLIVDNGIRFPEGIYFEDIPFSMETWFYSTSITATPRFVYFRTQRNDADNLSLTQLFSEKAFLDRDELATRVYEFSRLHTSDVKNAAGLGIFTLMSILGTSKNMLTEADADIKLKISAKWFPLHLLRINKMIHELNNLDKRYGRITN